MDSGRRKNAKIRAEEMRNKRAEIWAKIRAEEMRNKQAEIWAKIWAEEMEKKEVDRLSNLPEELIHHILSFMDTKFAVQTCLFSTRWRYQWTSLPILIFNSNTFHKLTSFDTFVSRVLSGIKSRSAASDVFVSGLVFTREGSLSWELLKEVVEFLESQRVQSLSISVDYNEDPMLLSRIFRLESLKHFKFTNYCFPVVLVYSFFNLQALTTLHLEKVQFSKFHSTHCFNNNLKKLTLVDCVTSDLGDLNISLSELESLTILGRNNHYNIRERNGDDCKFVVSAPKLTSLKLRGFPPLQLCAENIPSLEKVELDIRTTCKSTDNDDQFVASQFIKVLPQLGRAKSLTLSLHSIKVLSAYPDLLKHQPPFSNLKFLHTTLVVPDHVMTYLVGCSSGVEVVTEF